MASRFVDRAVIHLTAGDGGNGCASVHREKFKPLGGPDGGNGGNGGDVLLVVDPNVHTLLDFHFRPHAMAGNGKLGQGGNRAGAAGESLVMKVPSGTVVFTEDGELVADLIGPGTTFVAAQGGRGGLGNAALSSKARKAPGFALLGGPGEARDLVLELPEVEARGLQVFEVSTASRKGLRELTFALAKVVEQYRGMQPVLEPETIVLRPLAVDDSGFTVELDPEEEGAFIVRGVRPERWIRQADFGNDEAVGYLADRLHRLGVEDKLAKFGARPGSPVTIGDVQFEWEPSTPSVAMHLSGRGTDVRLEN